MKKYKITYRNFICGILIFLVSYFNALREIKNNCQAPTPRFNDLVSIFKISIDSVSSTYNAQFCSDWLEKNKNINAKDCYIKEVEIDDDNTQTITCHCWHKK